MKLAIITVTHDRPPGMRLLEKFMARQTRKPDLWIIVDDGMTPAIRPDVDIPVDLVRRVGCKPGNASFRGNMQAGFEKAYRANPDVVGMMEDDDWYSPDHIERSVSRIGESPATGCSFARYWHPVRRQSWTFDLHVAGVCASTFFSRDLWPFVTTALQAMNTYMDHRWDVHFWRQLALHRLNKEVHRDLTWVGIKGMPGGPPNLGIGVAANHHTHPKFWKDDPDCAQLREWIGPEESKPYEEMTPCFPPPRPSEATSSTGSPTDPTS